MGWTKERIELLKTYWSEGRSASQIAKLLGEGLTRNAVIGKAHRLGLASRPSPVRGGAEKTPPPLRAEGVVSPESTRNPDPAPADAAKPAGSAAPGSPRAAPAAGAANPSPVAARPARARGKAAPKAARVTLLDLNDRICKWPIGHPDEPDFHFCGKPVLAPFPYCAEHCALAYQAQQPRRDRPAGPMPPFRPNLPRPR